MRLTIELDPTEDRALFDRVMAAVMDHPAPVTMESSVAPDPAPESPVDTDEPAADRVYGEAGEGRKRRTKAEMAEDTEIEELAAEMGVKKIPTDIPATEVLEDLRALPMAEVPAEEISDADDPDEDDDAFDLDEDDSPMPLEDFRAEVIKANKALGGKAIKILSEYGKGITQIPEEKRREVLNRLASEMDD